MVWTPNPDSILICQTLRRTIQILTRNIQTAADQGVDTTRWSVYSSSCVFEFCRVVLKGIFQDGGRRGDVWAWLVALVDFEPNDEAINIVLL